MIKADKEGQRKAPILRFKGFTDAWEQRKLLKVCKKEDNKRIPIKEQERKEGNTPYFGANGIQGYIDGYTHDGTNILIAEDGANNVKNYPIKLITGKIWVNNHAHVLNVNTKTNNGNFLVGAIKKINFYRYLVGSSRYKLTAESLSQVKIEITEQSEQEKIGELFKSIEELLTLYDRKKELLKKFQQGFSDILFKKNSKECVSLGDCFYFNKGKNIGNKDLINNGKYYAIVYGELYTTYNYVISKVSSKTSVKGFEGRKNDLLFPSSSTVPFGTATCSALKVDNIELGNDIIIARPKDTNKLDSAFISYQINSKRKILYPIISGTTITHMYSKDLSKIKIWLPSIVTQKYISNILQRIDRLNLLVDKKINILKAIKKELLNTMFI